jgi:hypothetical protein
MSLEQPAIAEHATETGQAIDCGNAQHILPKLM